MKYLIGALVVLALLFLIWWFISRGKQRQLDEQRAEAASIRAAAEQRGATLRGQETFAQQSGERASLARQEAEERARQAEESAREAQRVEDEARRHQEDLERARRTHDAELRRADEIDPDVEVAEDDPRPLPEDLDDDVRPPDETRVHAPVPAAEPETRVHTPVPAPQSDAPASRSESVTFQPSAPAGAAATGAGAAAIGSAYAATRGDVTDDEAARLASGADYADNEPHVEESAAESTDTEWSRDEPTTSDWGMTDTNDTTDTTDSTDTTDTTDTTEGTDMSDTSGTPEGAADRTDTTATDDSTEQSDGNTTIINDVEDYASTEPLPAESAAPTDEVVETEDAATSTYDGSRDDLGDEDVTAGDGAVPSDEPTNATDVESADDASGDVESTDEAGDTAIIGDIEDYASTEPLPAESAAPTGEPTDDGSRDDLGDDDVATEDVATEDAATDVATDDGAAEEPTTEETWNDEDTSVDADDATVADTNTAAAADADASADADADASADADADSSVDAESTSDTEASTDGGDATHWPDGTDRINIVDDESDGTDSVAGEASDGEDSGENEGSADGDGDGSGRRISGVDEIRDGGFGVGSAAPFEDGAQPADHPVQAYHDTRTFRVPGAAGYDSAEPDVWFYDEEAARRAGFNPSQG